MNEVQKPRLLVVDDEVFVRDLLRDYFGKLGFEVVVAADGDAAVQCVERERFDAALVDLKMPGRGGLETIQALSALDPDMPAIVMTGYPTIESSIEALRIGAYDYVIKPFKLQHLKDAVDRALKEHALKLEIRQLRESVEALRIEIHGGQPAGSAGASAANAEPPGDHVNEDDIFGHIRELGELHASGHVTDEEFHSKKRELLSRL